MITLAKPLIRNQPKVSTGQKADLIIDTTTQLTATEIETISNMLRPRVSLSDQVVHLMHESRKALSDVCARGEAVYGVTTGFGPFVKFSADKPGSSKHGLGLVSHLGAGWGQPAEDRIVRAAMICRARSLACGHSGTDPSVLSLYLELIGRGIVPLVPEIGSVGASGDLIPLSYTARVLRGEGKVKVDGRTMSARSALKKAGLQPIQPSSRDVLGLVNGTSFMTAFALHALARLERLIDLAEQITGWAYRLLGCPLAALDPRLHMARGHVGQTLSARNIISHATKNGAAELSERPLQEIYSLRCAPQILGACRDQLIYATTLIEREINGANDNPLTFTATESSPSAVLHGGNFQGQQIAFASDVINAAATQTAVLAERQLDLILNPQHNGGAPLLLAWKPGPCSGLAGVQICATSLVAEMRHHQHPAATLSIPTNGGNQDVVSMGTTAARHAYHQMPRLAGVLSILSLGLHRLNDLRSCGRAVGQQSHIPEFAQSLPRFKEDRPLDDAVAELTHQFLDGTCN